MKNEPNTYEDHEETCETAETILTSQLERLTTE